MLSKKAVKSLERNIRILHEMEAAIGDRLTEIESSHPSMRPGKLVKANTEGYKTLKGRQRGYEAKRYGYQDELDDHNAADWAKRQS